MSQLGERLYKKIEIPTHRTVFDGRLFFFSLLMCVSHNK